VRSGELLREARKRSGLKLSDIRQAIGLTPSAVTRLETGDRHPSVQVLAQLAGCLEIDDATLAEVVRGYVEPPPARVRIPSANPKPPSVRLPPPDAGPAAAPEAAERLRDAGYTAETDGPKVVIDWDGGTE